MAVYVYRAVTDKGVIVRNRVEDINKSSLVKKLKRNNITPIQIVQVNRAIIKTKRTKRNIKDIREVIGDIDTANIVRAKERAQMTTWEKLNSALAQTEKITRRDLIIFTQNFYLLKKANFNNIHAISTIIGNTENATLREILKDILAGLESGENMYTTMEYYSDVFPYLYINMIKVGELSGSLTTSLEQAVAYLEDTDKITKKVRGILIPNIITFVLLLVMLFAGTIVAVPAIQNVFDSVGSSAKLPGITVWFSGVIDNLILYWYIPVIIIVAIIAAIIAYVHTPKGKYNYHYFKYTMPIFGKLIYALDFSRLMKAMLLNLNNGMRIQESLEVSKNVVKNYVMLSMIEASINNILIGQSWIEPFEKSNLSSSMIIEMLKIGMQTNLSEMMEKLVEYMEIDIDNTMQKIMKVLPELVYSIVGVVLIFFVLVVLVPCIEVYMGGFLFDAI